MNVAQELKTKIELITSLCLRKNDIKFLTGYKDTKVLKIMKICREDFNGDIVARHQIDNAITTESLLAYFKTNRKKYVKELLEILKELDPEGEINE